MIFILNQLIFKFNYKTLQYLLNLISNIRKELLNQFLGVRCRVAYGEGRPDWDPSLES